jgi:ATP-dependent DNA ligase
MGRIDSYVGPGVDGNRSDIATFQERGDCVCERKVDGIWGQLSKRDGRTTIVSRTGGVISDTKLEQENLSVFGPSFDLVGEVEVITQAALKATRKAGHVRMWLHEFTGCQGKDLREHNTELRQYLLREQYWPKLGKRAKSRFPLVEQAGENEDWTEFYDRIIAAGGEGVVIKRIGIPYRAFRSDGKSSDWIRIKPHREVDFVAMGPDQTSGGDLTVQLGLWENGQLVRKQNYQLPTARMDGDMLVYRNPMTGAWEPLVGVVVTMTGREVFDSGSLRSAVFKCWRPDKTPEMCDGTITFVEL